ncbi:B-cell scaffold protein with ankyrin repeats-like [Melanotaenia boesemani]|uniref:B-cell scaffold protein with ankyrin repeats-like n=1 Tax=Melanotaenia boesemani TaxID=1250792 RepID=UPI001C0408EF|nr:B-cell scaffold protein with ankyrin repeats-like [Melanotaenia boesemani]
MSQTGEDLLIIYETEAKQWATYLQSVFTGPVSEAGICCYDVATLSRRHDFLRLSRYTCKILILTKGMLEDFCHLRRFFLSRVLSPASNVVVLLCGVESLTPLLDLVPLNGDECLQLSSEQDAPEYLSTVIDIIRKGTSATAANINPQSASQPKVEQIHSSAAERVRSNVVVIPSRVPCGSSMEVFVLLKNDAAGCDCMVEFSAETQIVREKPVRWNERILCVNAPDFPAGNVRVTVYSGGKALINTQLQYYTSMEELACLLSRVADPVEFMCQALQVSSVDKLDQQLSSMLLEGMPTGGFQGLKSEATHKREFHRADVPSLLHFAAQYGFRNVSGLLLQCPGADRALCTTNRHGQTPTEIAKSHGHTELHILLKETLKMFNSSEDNDDASVYEMMCNTVVRKQQQDEDKDEEEDLYAPLGVNDEHDTTLNPAKALVITNRPPAPTPRPEGITEKDSKTPYIAQVFQKKKTQQGDADLYSLPTKQAAAEGSITSTYDTFIPNQMYKLHGLGELQQRLKAGLRTDETLERFSDWQQVQKGMDAKQEEKLSHLRAKIISNRNDDSVYDKISVVHHTSCVATNERRRASQPLESDFYSKPLKGQQMFRRSDKR